MINVENVYWTFSAAAQAVAAFIALLITGYALVLSMMESAVRADDTLIDINESLKKDYHKVLSILAIITAVSIISCLAVVYFNKSYYWWTIWLERIAVITTIISIFGGVYFVVSIIDPKKYSRKAISLSIELKPKSSDNVSPRDIFIKEFIELERLIRSLWEDRTDQGRVGRRGVLPGFREMVEALSKDEVLPFGIYQELLIVNRYRNLVFHGHIEELDKRIVENIIKIKEEVHRLTTG